MCVIFGKMKTGFWKQILLEFEWIEQNSIRFANIAHPKHKERKKMNLNLFHPSSCLVIGASQCGKTSLVRKMIRKCKYGNAVKRVKWCYSYPSPRFAGEPDFEFIQGLPTDFESGDLLVIDDLMHRLNENIPNLFTGMSSSRRERNSYTTAGTYFRKWKE